MHGLFIAMRGVHLYTANMQIETISTRHDSPPRVTLRPTRAQGRVTIDWSDVQELNADDVLNWLRLYPRTNDIHVYLPSVRRRSDHPRLQNSLQQLGCTVTARMCRV